MTISTLLDSASELTDSTSSKTAIVLMTRVRLARNLSGQPFPGWARPAQRDLILDKCQKAVTSISPLKRGLSLSVNELSELEKLNLVEPVQII